MEGDSVMEIRTTGIEFDKTPKKNPANQISSVLVFFFVQEMPRDEKVTVKWDINKKWEEL